MRAIIVLIVLALAAAGGFYLLTMPSLAVRGPLPARTANLANGETMFVSAGAHPATPPPIRTIGASWAAAWRSPRSSAPSRYPTSHPIPGTA